MSVTNVDTAPAQLQSLPRPQRYQWYRLGDDLGEYAVAAVAEAGEDLELHLVVTDWGLRARRGLVRDMEWLKDMARNRGKRRILGVKLETADVPDPRWPKFTRLFGFTNHCLIQSAMVDLQA